MNTLFLGTLLFFGGQPTIDTWPGFLGRDGTPLRAETIPLRWSPKQNIAWTTKLPGNGQSSPIIWGTKVFVTSAEGKMKDFCHVVAIELATGKIVWNHKEAAHQTVRANYFQSRAASTPVADGERVYAFFETGNLIALTHNGKIAWQRALTEDYGPLESTIGLASSPLLVNDYLVVLIDHEGPSYLLAVDKHTGKTKWKTARDSRVSYTSPSLVEIDGKPQIVCSSEGSVDGYDPATGKLLWTHEGVGGNSICTPLDMGGGRFLIGAAPGMHNEREENARQSNLCLQVRAAEGKFQTSIAWRAEKVFPAFASPVSYREHAYWVNRVGVVSCFDSKTGTARYSRRAGQTAWATPVGIGDRVYVFGKDGLTTVLAAGSDFRILAENQLWDTGAEGADPFNRERAERARSAEHGHEAPTAQGVAKGKAPAKPAEKGDPPSPARKAMSDQERAEARARGENRFADPVQYGVAIVNGSIVIRTGAKVYCVRHLEQAQAKTP